AWKSRWIELSSASATGAASVRPTQRPSKTGFTPLAHSTSARGAQTGPAHVDVAFLSGRRVVGRLVLGDFRNLRPALFFVLFAVSGAAPPGPPAPSLGESDSGTDGGASDSDRRDDVEASDSGVTERDADPDGGEGESSTSDAGPREVDASR